MKKSFGSAFGSASSESDGKSSSNKSLSPLSACAGLDDAGADDVFMDSSSSSAPNPEPSRLKPSSSSSSSVMLPKTSLSCKLLKVPAIQKSFTVLFPALNLHHCHQCGHVYHSPIQYPLIIYFPPLEEQHCFSEHGRFPLLRDSYFSP